MCTETRRQREILTAKTIAAGLELSQIENRDESRSDNNCKRKKCVVSNGSLMAVYFVFFVQIRRKGFSRNERAVSKDVEGL